VGKTVNDKVWFTYKARIRAHERLSRNDFYSQILLVWYALASTVLAIVVIRYPEVLGRNTDVISSVLSTALLVVSMLVTGRDYRGRSLEMRKNYLALQSLHRKLTASPPLLTPADAEQEYQVLLDSLENHAQIDDICARVSVSSTLTSREPSVGETMRAWTYVVTRFTILVACFLLPVALFTYAILEPAK
jgi:hypothetical protein